MYSLTSGLAIAFFPVAFGPMVNALVFNDP